LAQARLLYWQRRCLTYHAAADEVVYEQDPAAAAALLARGGGYVVWPMSGATSLSAQPVYAAALVPAC